MLEVATGSRLHFGLLELAVGQPMRFGGLGLMLEEPGWVLRFTKGLDLPDSGPANDAFSEDITVRINKVRQRLREKTGRDIDARIEVIQALPMHSGLGAGTQLAAAVATGLSLFSQLSSAPTMDELVQTSGRGKRSGIGLYGFLHGGLILDDGHAQETERFVSATSVKLARDWRVVLITPDQFDVVAGGYEASLLGRLGQTPNSNRERMRELAKSSLELANAADRFKDFTTALQEYVNAAGQLFAAEQGGMYNGELVSHAVQLANETGLRAVGQSSWGPTVFGFAEHQAEAEQIASKLEKLRPNERWQIRICTPARQGASWRWIES